MGKAIMAWFKVLIPHDVWTAGDVLYAEISERTQGLVQMGLLEVLEESVDTGAGSGKPGEDRPGKVTGVRRKQGNVVRGGDSSGSGSSSESGSAGPQAE